jgi:hypothetical protein
MSSYDGEDLFSSGPHRFAPSGTTMRVLEAPAPGVDGARLTVMGKAATRLRQTGRLVAADSAEVLALRDAIRGKCDGRAADLVDAQGCTHVNLVIERFDVASEIDLGRVASLTYEIDYVEAG